MQKEFLDVIFWRREFPKFLNCHFGLLTVLQQIFVFKSNRLMLLHYSKAQQNSKRFFNQQIKRKKSKGNHDFFYLKYSIYSDFATLQWYEICEIITFWR